MGYRGDGFLQGKYLIDAVRDLWMATAEMSKC